MGQKNNAKKIELLNGVLKELEHLGTARTDYLNDTYDLTDPKSLSPSYLRETINNYLELSINPNNKIKQMKNLDDIIKGQTAALENIYTTLELSPPEYTSVDNPSENTPINNTLIETPIMHIPDELLITETPTETPILPILEDTPADDKSHGKSLLYKVGTGLTVSGLMLFGMFTAVGKFGDTQKDIDKSIDTIKSNIFESEQSNNPFFDNSFWRSYLSFFEDLKKEGIDIEIPDELVEIVPEDANEIDLSADTIKDTIIDIISDPKGNLIYWDETKQIVPYTNYTQIKKKILDESEQTNLQFINTYSIDNFSLILNSDYRTEMIYKNNDLKKGPTGMLLKLTPKDEIEDDKDNTVYLTKDSSKALDSAIKQSYADEDKLIHILDDPFKDDELSVPAGMILTTQLNGVVFKNLQGNDDESTYLIVGTDNNGGYANGEYNSGNAWDQLNDIEKDNSNLFHSSSGGSAGTTEEDNNNGGGGRDGGDEY